MQTVQGFKHPLVVSEDYSKVNLALLLVHFLAGLQQEKAGYKGFSDWFCKDTVGRKRGGKKQGERKRECRVTV